MKNAASKVYLICGLLFAGIGSIFLPCAVAMGTHMDELIVHGTGNVKILPFTFGFTGGVALIVGTALLVYCWRSNQKKKKLVKHEDYVVAEITGFPPDYSVRVNGRPTHQVECKYCDPLTKTTYVFLSENIARNPSHITRRSVRVYVDRASGFNDYYVDVAPLFSDCK